MRLAQAAVWLGRACRVPAPVFGIGVTFQQLFLYGSPPRSALGEYWRGGWGALKAKPLFGRLPKLDGKKLHCV